MIKKTYITEEAFNFEAGGSIDHLTIAYHISKEYEPGDKVIVIFHGLTANSDPEDWWPQIVGPGKLFDTQKYFILCVNMLGSPYGTDGPTSLKEDGTPYYFDFPRFTIRDMTRASILVSEHIGIEGIDLLVGSSIGGFQAVEWAIMKPEMIKNALFIATAPRISPWLLGTVEAQRMALEADQTFRECKSLEGGAAGLACARAQAILSYRCHDCFNATQSEPDEDFFFATRPVTYEQHQAQKLVKRFDAYSYWYLCNAFDSHNPGRGRGGLQKALGTISADTTVISIDTDLDFPSKEAQTWSKWIPGAKYREINSLYGHDGFLLEYAQLTEIIKPILEKCKF